MLKVDFLCSDLSHPVVEYLDSWKRINQKKYNISLNNRSNSLEGGNFLFLISCHEIIKDNIIDKYENVLVLHASNLPNGKGWSPLVWQILQGKEEITLSLIEANKRVDTGRIWLQKKMKFYKHQLHGEINKILFESEIFLINKALKEYKNIKPKKQKKISNIEIYEKRNPKDSELDINKNLKSQFNLLRISDPERYPAYFKIHGKKFKITIEEYEKN